MFKRSSQELLRGFTRLHDFPTTDTSPFPHSASNAIFVHFHAAASSAYPSHAFIMRNVPPHYDNFPAAAAGARLLAEFHTIQQSILTASTTYGPAGHFTINYSRRRLLNLTQIADISPVRHLRSVAGAQQEVDPRPNG
jgi:hypothetical protein